MPSKRLLACGISALSLSLSLSMACAASPDVPFSGPDLSGFYVCTGHDASDGDYKATVKLKLDRKHSHGPYGSYAFEMDADGYGIYPGAAATNGLDMAITFANRDPAKKDYGTGIAKVTLGPNGAVKFEKFYYQLEYKGGNSGVESCVRKSA